MVHVPVTLRSPAMVAIFIDPEEPVTVMLPETVRSPAIVPMFKDPEPVMSKSFEHK